MSRIADTHDELYHYTTADGLSGILKDKCLWATHASFVNDEEEIVGFYARILPEILCPIHRKYLENIKDDPEFKKRLGNSPFDSYCKEGFEKIMSRIRSATSNWHDHYITSFSTVEKGNHFVREHGLLSQWRAYGSDGGYAVILDTDQLEKIASEETKPYEDVLYFGDVQYGPLNENLRTSDTDTNQWIKQLEIAADKYFRSGTAKDAEELARPLTTLSCVFKHFGFSEEKEVRLVLSLLGPKLEHYPELQSVRQHAVKTRIREGTTVPYVDLCVRVENGVKQHLPIKRIIVGPHRDKNDRKRAVQLLLKQHGLNDLIDKVDVSDISYRGG